MPNFSNVANDGEESIWHSQKIVRKTWTERLVIFMKKNFDLIFRNKMTDEKDI
jgi:hypothetical protein